MVTTTTSEYRLTFDDRKYVFDDDVEIASKVGFCIACTDEIEKGDRIRFGHYGPHRQDYSKIHDSCFIGEAHDAGYTLPEDRAIEITLNNEISPNKRNVEVTLVELPPGKYSGRNKYSVQIAGRHIWATSDLRRAEGAVAVLQLLDLDRLF